MREVGSCASSTRWKTSTRSSLLKPEVHGLSFLVVAKIRQGKQQFHDRFLLDNEDHEICVMSEVKLPSLKTNIRDDTASKALFHS